MRYFLTIVAAMFAVACSRVETSDNLQEADQKVSASASEAEANIENAYEEAKPELKELGANIAEGAKEVGGEIKETVHEATAPKPGDRSEPDTQPTN